MAMVFAGAMDNGKIEQLHMRYPLCDHPLWFSEVAEPRQASMVGYYCKMLSRQVISKQLYRHHYCQQLLISGAVTVLSVAEGFGGIRYYSFNNLSSFILVLF